MFIATPEGPLECLQTGRPGTCTIVLVHGIQGTATIWNPVLDELGPDWRVVAPHLRGRAGSFAPAAADRYRMRDFAADLDAVLGQVDGPVVLVGWSMGGLVALEYLRTYGSGNLIGLALISGSACLSPSDGPEAVWFRGEAAEDIARDAADRKIRLNLTETATDLAVAGSWLSARAADYRTTLSRIDLPTLVLHGDADPECPVDHGRRLSRGIPAARLKVWTECGHMPMAHDPAGFAAAIRGFTSCCVI